MQRCLTAQHYGIYYGLCLLEITRNTQALSTFLLHLISSSVGKRHHKWDFFNIIIVFPYTNEIKLRTERFGLNLLLRRLFFTKKKKQQIIITSPLLISNCSLEYVAKFWHFNINSTILHRINPRPQKWNEWAFLHFIVMSL